MNIRTLIARMSILAWLGVLNIEIRPISSDHRNNLAIAGTYHYRMFYAFDDPR